MCRSALYWVDNNLFKLTTGVRVIPDVLPFALPASAEGAERQDGSTKIAMAGMVILRRQVIFLDAAAANLIVGPVLS